VGEFFHAGPEQYHFLLMKIVLLKKQAFFNEINNPAFFMQEWSTKS
jgi:hypothetical protein